MAGNTILEQAVGCAFSFEPYTSLTHPESEHRSSTVNEAEHTYLLRVRSEDLAKVLEAVMSSLEPLIREHAVRTRLRKSEELVKFLTDKLVVPSDVDVSMARRLAARRARLLKEFGSVTAEQLAAVNRSRAANRHALADNWKKRRLVFSFLHPDTKGRLREVFPLFQFEDHRPIKAVREIIEAFGERKSPWKLALWFTSNNGWLPNQARPVDLLTSLPNAVIEAARRDAGGSAA
jgi:hypothetical protein